MKSKWTLGALTVVLAAGLAALPPANVSAHCDTAQGPVVLEAKAALERGDVTPILKWVKPEHEAEIRAAFGKAVAVRAKGPDAREIADRFLLETLVRLHRAGEGFGFTGIRDEPPEPILAMSDKALAEGSADRLVEAMGRHMAAAIRERFERVSEAAKHRDESVEAGREYVEAYVIYTHYVENVHDAIVSAGGHGH